MKTFLKIILSAAATLIIPLLGNTYVDGWNWTWHDFLFAWVFWVVLVSTIVFASWRFSKYQLTTGVATFVGFVAVWVLLATS